MGFVFNSFLGLMFFPFSSIENSVLLRLEKGTSIRRNNLQNQGLLFFLAFGMCFCRFCYSIYEPIYHINHSKQTSGLLQQAYHILDMGTQSLGANSIGLLSPLFFCKFLNNCETNCRHTAASAKNKKNEFAVNLVLKNLFLELILTVTGNIIAILHQCSI